MAVTFVVISGARVNFTKLFRLYWSSGVNQAPAGLGGAGGGWGRGRETWREHLRPNLPSALTTVTAPSHPGATRAPQGQISTSKSSALSSSYPEEDPERGTRQTRQTSTSLLLVTTLSQPWKVCAFHASKHFGTKERTKRKQRCALKIWSKNKRSDFRQGFHNPLPFFLTCRN